MPRTGGCFCGHVRYEITGDVLNETVCHCPGCRKSSGAAAVPWITVNTLHFKLTRGELAEVRSDQYPQASCDGCGGTRTFCPRCGSPISFKGDNAVDPRIDVTLGSLDDPQAFTPREDVWAQYRLPWIGPVKPQEE